MSKLNILHSNKTSKKTNAAIGAMLLASTFSAAPVFNFAFAQNNPASLESLNSSRNATLVSYTGSSWTEYTDCNYRGGCQSIIVNLKVLIKPTESTNLAQKRVGVGYHTPGNTELSTAYGHYFSTKPDGTEEWHVPVYLGHAGMYSPGILFAPWYEDGNGNAFYDDNNGQMHFAATHKYGIIYVDNALTSLTQNPEGVEGKIVVRLLDLDYEKDISIVYTTDGWKTTQTLTMNSRDTVNSLYFVKKNFSFEEWNVDVKLAGSFPDKFQFAVCYKHGGKNGAKTYEFWDNNNGKNYFPNVVLQTPSVQ